MSAWGTRSFDNDFCHDNLFDETNAHPSQNDADKNVAYVFSKKFLKDNAHMGEFYLEKSSIQQCQLGVILWYLFSKCSVQEKYLRKGVDLVEALWKNKKYLENWKRPEARIDALKQELIILYSHLTQNDAHHEESPTAD